MSHKRHLILLTLFAMLFLAAGTAVADEPEGVGEFSFLPQIVAKGQTTWLVTEFGTSSGDTVLCYYYDDSVWDEQWPSQVMSLQTEVYDRQYIGPATGSTRCSQNAPSLRAAEYVGANVHGAQPADRIDISIEVPAFGPPDEGTFTFYIVQSEGAIGCSLLGTCAIVSTVSTDLIVGAPTAVQMRSASVGGASIDIWPGLIAAVLLAVSLHVLRIQLLARQSVRPLPVKRD